MLTKRKTTRKPRREKKPDANTMFEATISCAMWDMLTHCARTPGTPGSPGRYAIAGVLVERKRGVLVLAATDGHRLALLEREDTGPEFTCLVPADLLRNGHKAPATITEATLTYWPHQGPTGRLALKHGHVAVDGEAMEGKFPPYREVVPEHTDTGKHSAGAPVIHVNPVYLADAAVLAARFHRRHGDGVVPRITWRHRAANKPFVLECTAGEKKPWTLRVVLMPVSTG